MDKPRFGEETSKSIKSLPESLRSLLGFKEFMTPNWVESVSRIIKELPYAEVSGDSLWSSTAEEIESPGSKDAETETSNLKIQAELAILQAHLSQLNMRRRQVLNDYLDLKGNIRVFCRVRPSYPEERCYPSRCVITMDESNIFLKIAESKSKQYNFDKVFHPQSTQEQVFSEIEPVIKSALDGYNACIFAYGQTGTGKTYTMEGRPDCPGVVSRGIEAMFNQASESNQKFVFTFSMLEIYMGSLRDLLVPQRRNLNIPKSPCLTIHTDPNGGIEIEKLIAIEVSTFEQVKQLYNQGSRLRSTASTMSNCVSSRSHCLIRISLTCLSASERRRETNKIWMVDLGGSERLLKTQASGIRLEEGKAINLSLSALGDVISSLQSRKHHVPYRNSKLTQVLRDSLGSDSKTLMLVHVSPREEDICETVCSLGFATRVRSIHLGSEETNEARVKKEVAMTELLQKVKDFESARLVTKTNIEKLQEKLKQSGRLEAASESHSEVPILSNGGMQTDAMNNMKNHTDYTGTSGRLPRFMKPTVCSKRKTGLNHQVSVSMTGKPPIPKKKWKSSSVYAESIASPANTSVWQSKNGSECSVPRANYLNWKNNAYARTECNQEVSKCEIKEVIFPEQEKAHRSLTTSQVSDDEIEDSLADMSNQDKHLTVDSWLLRVTKRTSTFTKRSKRVIDIPVDKISNSCNKKNRKGNTYKEEKQHCVNTRNLQTSNWEHMNDIKEDVNFYNMASEALSVEKSQKPKKMDVEHSFLVNSSSHSTHSEYYQNKDLDTKSEKNKLVPEGQAYLLTATCFEAHGDPSTPPPLHDDKVSEESCCRDVYESQQHKEESNCLHIIRSRRSLFTEKDLPALDQNAELQDIIVPATSLGKEKHSGTLRKFQQKVETFWATALLVLRMRDLGFEHDFYHGLIA